LKKFGVHLMGHASEVSLGYTGNVMRSVSPFYHA
jgi:hypothetical protein